MTPGLDVFVGGGVGLVVEDVLGQEGFHQTHQRDRQRRGKHHPECVEIEGDATIPERQAEGGESGRERPEAADGGNLEAEADADAVSTMIATS